VEQLRRRYHEADALYRASLALRWDTPHQQGIVWCIEGLAVVAALQGDTLRAARLGGAAQTQRKIIGATLSAYDELRLSAALLGKLSATEPAAWAEGHRMTVDQAVAHALSPLAFAPRLYNAH
jgi:hypothetical protein